MSCVKSDKFGCGLRMKKFKNEKKNKSGVYGEVLAPHLYLRVQCAAQLL